MSGAAVDPAGPSSVNWTRQNAGKMLEPLYSRSADAASGDPPAASGPARGSDRSARPPQGDDIGTLSIKTADEKLRIVLDFLSGKTPVQSMPENGYSGQPDVVAWCREFIRAGEIGLRSRPTSEDAVRYDELREHNKALRRQLRVSQAQVRLWTERAGGELGPLRTSRRSAKTRRCRSRGFPRLSASRAAHTSVTWRCSGPGSPARGAGAPRTPWSSVFRYSRAMCPSVPTTVTAGFTC